MGFLAQAVLPSFVAPGLAAAGLAAISIPILIHILSRRPRKPEPWAAMRFLMAAYRKHRVRTRLEQLLLLLCRCALVALLGLALAGPIGAAIGALSSAGRTYVIVIDPSLTSGVRDTQGAVRLEMLRDSARVVLDGLTSSDRVALILADRPARLAVWPPTPDRETVRRVIDGLKPSDAAAELSEALGLSMRMLQETNDPSRPTRLLLLSDFSAGAVRLDRPLPERLAPLGGLAQLSHVVPAAAAPNVSLLVLTPDRRLVIADAPGEPPVIEWTLRLKRSGPMPEATTPVRLTQPGAETEDRTVRWAAGQADAELRWQALTPTPGAAVAMATAVSTGPDVDALEADNRQWMPYRVHRRLVALVLDRRGEESDRPAPAMWLGKALAPVPDLLGWPLEIRHEDAATLDAPHLSQADAVYVLRPDLLTEKGWDALATWTRSGGLVWFSPPAEAASTLWPQHLADRFGLGWSIALEPMDHQPPLRVDADRPAIAELARLSGEINFLLRPMTVERRLVIDPATLNNADLLMTGAGGEPILVAGDTPKGRGRVLLSAVAMDDRWSNAHTKPLFVPLVQETLRAAIDRLEPVRVFAIGDQPDLPETLGRAGTLEVPDGSRLALVRQDGSVRPVRPFAVPGLYRAGEEPFAVNVDASAADTGAVDPAALERWLSACGTWQTFEAPRPIPEGVATGERVEFGWPLLWLAAMLALTEMALARWVSHASTRGRSADAMSIAPSASSGGAR